MITQIHPDLTCKTNCDSPNHYPNYYELKLTLGPGLYVHTCDTCDAQCLIHIRADKPHIAVFVNYQDIEAKGQWLQSPVEP